MNHPHFGDPVLSSTSYRVCWEEGWKPELDINSWKKVNPGLINPYSRLFNWDRYHWSIGWNDYWRSTPLINKPLFINPGLTLANTSRTSNYPHHFATNHLQANQGSVSARLRPAAASGQYVALASSYPGKPFWRLRRTFIYHIPGLVN